MDYQQDFATESTQTTTDPKRRYLCRHIFTDGHRCGSPALRRQPFCYYHRLARPSVTNEGRPTIFQMPPIGDRPAIHNAIFEVLTRAAGGDLEYRHASILFYGLQLASNNLTRMESAIPTTEPLVEEIMFDTDGGFLAPIAEYPEPAASSECHPERAERVEGPAVVPPPTHTAPPGAPCQTASPSDAGMYPATSDCHPERSLALAPNAVEGPEVVPIPAPTINEQPPINVPPAWDPLHDSPPTRELILAAVQAVAAPNVFTCASTSRTPRSGHVRERAQDGTKC